MPKNQYSNQYPITEAEFELRRKIVELENSDRRMDQQRRMAGWALISMIVVVFLFFVPFVGIERIDAITPIIQTFLGAASAVVMVFFGASAYTSRSNQPTVTRASYDLYGSPVVMNQPFQEDSRLYAAGVSTRNPGPVVWEGDSDTPRAG
jgi:hypothetical protein